MDRNVNRGIVLMNLGSPDSPEVKDVRKYLKQFLMDERVMDIPFILRFILVHGMIVPFRARRSASAYRSIWTSKGSPLIALTKSLQFALEQHVEDDVAIAMRYGNPGPKEAFDFLLQNNPDIEEVLLLPLYPHYAMASFETAVVYAKEVHKKFKYGFRLSVVPPYFDNADYILALSESIRPFIQKKYDHILFSYHGLPERHILKGDLTGSHCLKLENCCQTKSPSHQYCYRHQCLTTMNLVTESLSIPANKSSFSFQSRLGRDEWLKPYTAVRLQELLKAGVKNLLVVCPAFVSDCLETLEEIAMEGKENFLRTGGESFTAIPCLNVNPLWVKALCRITSEYGQSAIGNRQLAMGNGQ